MANKLNSFQPCMSSYFCVRLENFIYLNITNLIFTHVRGKNTSLRIGWIKKGYRTKNLMCTSYCNNIVDNGPKWFGSNL